MVTSHKSKVRWYESHPKIWCLKVLNLILRSAVCVYKEHFEEGWAADRKSFTFSWDYQQLWFIRSVLVHAENSEVALKYEM